ncbi:MAG: SpoIIE family protein phosphatase [Bacteroidia bacterium]
MNFKITGVLLAVFFNCNLIAQREMDSLQKVVSTSADSNKVKAMLVLARKYYSADTAKARRTYNEVIDLSLKLNYKEGVVFGFCQKAAYLSRVNHDSVAFNSLKGALKYIDTIKPNSFHAKYLITLGSIYIENGKVPLGINCYLLALKISDQIHDKKGIATAYNGLQFANTRIKNEDRGEYYALKALAIYQELNDLQGIAQMNSSLGGAYLGRAFRTKKASDYSKAYDYLTKSAETNLKMGELHTAAVCYTNLGALFGSKGNYPVALQYCRKALDLKTRIGNKNAMATTMMTMSNIFTLQKQLDSVEHYTLKALSLAKEVNAPSIIKSAYEDLAFLYEQKKDPSKALSYFKMYKTLNDSLENADKLKTLAELESKYESEKKDKEILMLGELEKVKDQEISKQKIINYTIGGGLALVLILSFFVFKQYHQKKKANHLLELQNSLINEKNRNITDSINYAKVIQEAILPNETGLITLLKKAFVVFKPKDIVSGDFYWFSEKNGRKIVAAVDCTGHGVPGAFMSLIGTTFLNEIINEKGITEPAKILSELRDRVKASLKQKGAEGESKDGMDMALLSFAEDFSFVEYAGANNSLWKISGEGIFEEIAPDKRPIGYFRGQGLPFTNHRIALNNNDNLYIFTDGYADQFGGPKGKKFKYKQLKDILLEVQCLPTSEQKKILDEKIENWRGKLEQTDDICLVGIKIDS